VGPSGRSPGRGVVDVAGIKRGDGPQRGMARTAVTPEDRHGRTWHSRQTHEGRGREVPRSRSGRFRRGRRRARRGRSSSESATTAGPSRPSRPREAPARRGRPAGRGRARGMIALAAVARWTGKEGALAPRRVHQAPMGSVSTPARREGERDPDGFRAPSPCDARTIATNARRPCNVRQEEIQTIEAAEAPGRRHAIMRRSALRP